MVTGYTENPMMSPTEVMILDELLSATSPKICLEIGAGGSTIYFPKRHPEIKRWKAIEHNGYCAGFLENRVLKVVDLRYHQHEKKYFNAITEETYDFILIDGLKRKKCVALLPRLLNKNGIAVLHDASRKKYQQVIRQYNGLMLCQGEYRVDLKDYSQGGIALFNQKLLSCAEVPSTENSI